MKEHAHAPTRKQTRPRAGRRERSPSPGPQAPSGTTLDASAHENGGVAHVARLDQTQAIADASAVVQATAGYPDTASNSLRVQSCAQLQRDADSSAHVARLGRYQAIADASAVVQAATGRQDRAQDMGMPRENRTGLPDDLKTGIERLSGLSMDSVRVHFNSTEPKKLNALAYTQGRDIHIGPGQERHLAHEAWHVVQQAQGRVQPTLQLRGVTVNDDAALEREADAMGDKAASHAGGRDHGVGLQAMKLASSPGGQPVQRKALVNDRLNVAGENHIESNARRDKEKAIALTQADGGYWEENEFMVDVTDDTQAEADPNVLKFLTVLHDITRLSRLIYEAKTATSCVAMARDPNLLIPKLITLAEQQYAKGVGVAYPSFDAAPLIPEKTDSRDEVLGKRYTQLQKLKTALQSLATVKAGYLKPSQQETVRAHQRDMQVAAETIIGMTMEKPHLDLLRSKAMHLAAEKMVATKGIWKIGDSHVTDIKTNIPEAQPAPTYNLLTKDEFDDIVDKE